MLDATTVERPSLLTGLAHSGIALGAIVVIIIRELLSGPSISEPDGSDLFATITAPIRGFLTGPGPQRSGAWFVIAGAALGVVALAGIWGLFTAHTTRFVADVEEFRVERRFISTSSKRLDYTKVQSVELSQPFTARLLGLAKVHIDVGGAGGINLAFLTLTRAEAMRELLLARTTASATAESGHQETAESNHREEAPETTDETVVRMSPATLTLGTLISTNALLGLSAGMLMWLFTWWTKSPVAILGVTLGIIGWLHSQIGNNWGFTMTRHGETLRISRGLASKRTQGLHPERIQGVVISQDALQRLTGLYRMHVTVLGFMTDIENASSATNSLVLPFGSKGDVDRVLQAIWPTVGLDSLERHRPGKQARWLNPLAYKRMWWGLDSEVLATQHGWLLRSVTAVPHRRMQSLGIQQGPLQRRLGLATVQIHTTDGPVALHVRHLSQADARALFETQVERARKARALHR